LDKAKTLLEKIVKESEAQKRKYNETMEEANKHKILIDRLNDKKSDKAEDFIDTFAEMFSQVRIERHRYAYYRDYCFNQKKLYIAQNFC
jgi:hypothetical protein